MKKTTFSTCLTSLLVFISCVVTAQTTTTVTTTTQLSSAISSAVAGSTIILKNGTWSNTYINIKKTGTAAKPITIKAETPGMVFLEGNSRIAMGGAYIFIEGIIFRNPANIIDQGTTLEPVIEFRDSGNTICNNCKVTNVKIDTYNGSTAQQMDTFKWILLYGTNNEISYCSFIGKKGIGSIINDNRDTAYLNYTKIHHNYFADRSFIGAFVDENNDQDAIRIGNSGTSLSNSYTEVYDNFFNNWFGEIEIISNKSCNNKYYNNTFRNYSGSLTLRHGNNCEVSGNYFFANNNQFSGGVRIIGENHKIYNNYFEATNAIKYDNTTSTNLGAISVMKGSSSSVNGADLSGYYQVKNTTITNNTFVNCDAGIRIGGGSSSSQTLAPLTLVVANNIFLMNSTTKKAIEQSIPAISTSPYTFSGNIRQSGTWTTTGTQTSNTISTSGLLTSGTDFYRVQTGSAAINTGIGTYSFLTKDILNASRPTAFDAGAEEFGAGGTKLPYKVSDVGTKLGFLGTNTVLSTSTFSVNTGIKVYPIPVESGNSLTIESENTIGNLIIFDLLGRKLFSTTIDENSAQIPTTNLSKGIYILKTTDTTLRFIIK